MRKIIMPVSPLDARQMLNGQKNCLFKKYRPRSPVGAMLLYTVPPFKARRIVPPYHQIVGEVTVLDIVEAEPEYIWRQFGNGSGLSKSEFDRTFGTARRAVAYLFGPAVPFESPQHLENYGFANKIRSFVYVK